MRERERESERERENFCLRSGAIQIICLYLSPIIAQTGVIPRAGKAELPYYRQLPYYRHRSEGSTHTGRSSRLAASRCIALPQPLLFCL